MNDSNKLVDNLVENYELVDEGLLDEEFSEGYEEGFLDGKDSNDLNSKTQTIAERNLDSIYFKRENTRSRLAIIYTVFTFSVFFVGMAIAVLDGLARKVSIIENLEVIIPLISGVFLGTLGFVLGYYFRKGEEDSSKENTINL